MCCPRCLAALNQPFIFESQKHWPFLKEFSGATRKEWALSPPFSSYAKFKRSSTLTLKGHLIFSCWSDMFVANLSLHRTLLVAQLVKNPPAMWETWVVQSLGWDDPLEKGKATHSSILAWRILYSPCGCEESDMTERPSLSLCITYSLTQLSQKPVPLKGRILGLPLSRQLSRLDIIL